MLSVATALRGVRVLTPAAAAELPRLADDVAMARQRIARAEAERLALLDSVRNAAHQLGWRDGHARAIDELAAFNAGLRALASNHASALHSLLLRALRRLLGELPPELVVAQLAERALLVARDEATKVQVFVHPQHCAAVSERLRAPAGLAIEVRADPGLGPTDCRVETGVGSIDASLATQLAALEAASTHTTLRSNAQEPVRAELVEAPGRHFDKLSANGRSATREPEFLNAKPDQVPRNGHE